VSPVVFISQKTAFFIVTALKTSNLTWINLAQNGTQGMTPVNTVTNFQVL
jgi:hypothetical protein